MPTGYIAGMRHYTQFYQAAKFLKKHLPFPFPVRVRRVVIPESNDGDCCFAETCFLVRVEKRLPEYYALEILIHELAHALSWEKDKDVHGKHWGIAYSKVYRVYLRFLEAWEKQHPEDHRLSCN